MKILVDVEEASPAPGDRLTESLIFGEAIVSGPQARQLRVFVGHPLEDIRREHGPRGADMLKGELAAPSVAGGTTNGGCGHGQRIPREGLGLWCRDGCQRSDIGSSETVPETLSGPSGVQLLRKCR